MGLPPAFTVPDPPDVVAEQCLLHPGLPQQGCGVTDILGTTTGRPLIRTELSPLTATPPAELASPCRCTAGILS
jgi:hypothetical protein